MAKFDVKVGDKFEIAGVEIEDIGIVERLAELDERRRVSKQQAFIVCAVLVASSVALRFQGLAGMEGWHVRRIHSRHGGRWPVGGLGDWALF